MDKLRSFCFRCCNEHSLATQDKPGFTMKWVIFPLALLQRLVQSPALHLHEQNVRLIGKTADQSEQRLGWVTSTNPAPFMQESPVLI